MIPELALQVINNIIILTIKVVDGQPPEVRKQLWEWYVEDIKWWRKHLGIEKEKS